MHARCVHNLDNRDRIWIKSFIFLILLSIIEIVKLLLKICEQQPWTSDILNRLILLETNQTFSKEVSIVRRFHSDICINCIHWKYQHSIYTNIIHSRYDYRHAHTNWPAFVIKRRWELWNICKQIRDDSHKSDISVRWVKVVGVQSSTFNFEEMKFSQ